MEALRIAVSAVAPGGTLLVVAHDADNLIRGVGGPPDPEVLYRADEVADVARNFGLVIEQAGQVTRTVVIDGERREAVDTLVKASRPMNVAANG
jgi:hypothetical protein